jgi:hypothetical protein
VLATVSEYMDIIRNRDRFIPTSFLGKNVKLIHVVGLKF